MITNTLSSKIRSKNRVSANDSKGNERNQMPTVTEGWRERTAKYLQRNPGQISQHAKDAVGHMDAAKKAAQRAKEIKGTMKGGSVPHVERKPHAEHKPFVNPWGKPRPEPLKTTGSKGGILVGKPYISPPREFPQTKRYQFKNESIKFVWNKKKSGQKLFRPETIKSEEVLSVDEVSPPGWSGTTKALKKHSKITNPFALSWWMHNKGYKPHITPEKK